MVRTGVASWSFHRLLEAGKQDMMQYIRDCKALGCATLEPWNGHLAPLVKASEALRQAGDTGTTRFAPDLLAYVEEVKGAAAASGMPFGCLAVDGAHIWEPTVEARAANRAAAYRWLDVTWRLNAAQMRIDSGGDAVLTDEMFTVITEGFRDLVARAKQVGVEIVIENHWGASQVPENVVRLLDAVDGLGLLLDTHNFAEGTADRGWVMLAPRARALHIKTFAFDAEGNETTVDVAKAVRLLKDAGYHGVWGVESVPHDGDELGCARKSLELVRRLAG